MTVRQRIVATVAALAVATAGLFVAAQPAQATIGCHMQSPWAIYPVSWSSRILTTNRFIAQGCGVRTVTPIDLIYVRDSSNTSQCAYFRVELFYSDGRSMGAFTVNGPWTWLLVCDDQYPQPLLVDMIVGDKYDIQMMPMPDVPLAPLWLGDELD